MADKTPTIDDIKPKFIKWLELAKEFFNSEKKKFTEDTLTDGTVISYDGDVPLANMPVFVLDDKGNQIPLMDGTYVIADDSVTITVAGGVITDVKGAEPDASKTGTPPAKPNPNQAMTDAEKQAKTIIESIVKESRFVSEDVMNEKFKALEEKFVKLGESSAEKIGALTKENETLKGDFAKQKDLSAQLFDIVKKIADQPADKPVTRTKTEGAEKTLEEKVKEFSKQVFKS